MKTNRKQAKKLREIAHIAAALRQQAHEAHCAYFLLDTKARLAKAIDDNGASIDSLAEKLGWDGERLYRVFGPGTDIDIRALSDIYTALGREVHFKVAEKLT
jgi:DNA-binding phage protein